MRVSSFTVPESPQNEEMPGDYTLSQLSLQPGAGDGESVNILDKVNQWLVGPDVADDGDFDDILQYVKFYAKHVSAKQWVNHTIVLLFRATC